MWPFLFRIEQEACERVEGGVGGRLHCLGKRVGCAVKRQRIWAQDIVGARQRVFSCTSCTDSELSWARVESPASCHRLLRVYTETQVLWEACCPKGGATGGAGRQSSLLALSKLASQAVSLLLVLPALCLPQKHVMLMSGDDVPGLKACACL